MVPTFTQQSIDQVGARLYPDSIATATPQTFTVTSPPIELDGFGVQRTAANSGDAPVRCRPAHIHQVRARLRDYGASDTGSPLRVTPSDLAQQARTVWQYRHIPPLSGPLATRTAVPRLGLPSASPNESGHGILPVGGQMTPG